jgi:hypothetical protein
MWEFPIRKREKGAVLRENRRGLETQPSFSLRLGLETQHKIRERES